MNILFIHQNFPGQYRHVAPALAARGHRVVAMSINPAPALPGVANFRYAVTPPAGSGAHPLVREFEVKTIRGDAAARAAQQLAAQGFSPDVICAHPGWGESLFLKDVWPRAKLLCFCEFYYRESGSDVNFDPEFLDERVENRMRLRLKNANNLLSLEAADAGVSPTHWQRAQFPEWIREKISVIHDGIDTTLARPDSHASISVRQGALSLSARDEVVTYVSRSLEPYRGYHTFIRALPALLRNRPQAHILIVGREGTSYGAAPSGGKSWKEIFLGEVADGIDLSRVHFLGQVPYADYLKILQISSAHVYLTYPFVLSWSLLEAMSAGCLVVGSRTPPVEEVIHHMDTGLLTDFFSPGELAERISDALANQSSYRQLRTNAREFVRSRFDLKSLCLPAHVAMIESLGQEGN